MFLFEETKYLARTLHRHFGLSIPEINLAPISWRLIYSLGGTRESWPARKGLSPCLTPQRPCITKSTACSRSLTST